MKGCAYVVIGIVGVPANYGGFETLVENLIEGTSGKDTDDILVFCSSEHYESKPKKYKRANLIYLPIKANGVSSIFYDAISLILSLRYKPKAILVLGVSGAIILPLIRWIYKGKIVTNIDGLEWRRDKWGKITKKYLKLSERFAVKYSDAIVSDNEAITDYVRAEYSVDAVTIAYGGDHALKPYQADTSLDEYALTICRIEPENNIHIILEAFDRAKEKIKFIGNWNANAYGRSLKEQYSGHKQIELIDPIYDLDILSAIRKNCSFYVHGHSAGGTNPSLVEMMHFGKSILCFDCSYNRATTENKALYFSDSDELVDYLSSGKNIINNNGAAMSEIANRRYRWSIIKKQYEQILNVK